MPQPPYSLPSFIILRDGCRLKDNIRIDPSPVYNTHTLTHTHTYTLTHTRTQAHSVSTSRKRTETGGVIKFGVDPPAFSGLSLSHCLSVLLHSCGSLARQQKVTPTHVYDIFYKLVFFLTCLSFFCYIFEITRKMFYSNCMLITLSIVYYFCYHK